MNDKVKTATATAHVAGEPCDKMTFEEYGNKAFTLAIYPRGESMLQNMVYPTLGLAGEAGEVAEKIKKLIRGGGGFDVYIPQETRDTIVKELGDVLWYINACAREINATLEEVAATNLDKLFDRKDRNQLHGEGDDR
jgi:NTP pyrophosphatase (non-canonical NTP hydrolase)